MFNTNLLYGSAIHSRVLSRRNEEDIRPLKDVYVNAHGGMTNKSQKGEQMSLNWGIGKQVCFTHSVEYLSAIKGPKLLIDTKGLMNPKHDTK